MMLFSDLTQVIPDCGLG